MSDKETAQEKREREKQEREEERERILQEQKDKALESLEYELRLENKRAARDLGL